MSDAQHSLRKLQPDFVISPGTQVVVKVSKALPQLTWLSRMEVGQSLLRLSGEAYNTNAIAADTCVARNGMAPPNAQSTVAAIRSAQLGLSTACVDKWINDQGKPALGGTCLNVGCIPSKTLLESSENYHKLQHSFAEHGISVSGAKVDIAKMQARKDKIVAKSAAGVNYLMKKNKIEVVRGLGRLDGPGRVSVDGPDGATAVMYAATAVASALTWSETSTVIFSGMSVGRHSISSS